MKTQLSFAAITILFLHSSWVSPVVSQPTSSMITVKKESTISPGFSFFRTHRQARGIMTTWGLTSNAGVTGFVVQKTYEDPSDPYAYWEDICAMPCGVGRSFKHHDLNVSPGFINYRVIAYLQSGGSVVSAIATEHIISH
jgi:hypothetical protein